MTAKVYQLPELGYAFDALEPAYSADLLELHYSKHHQAYVKGANEVLQDLASARKTQKFEHLNQLQQALAFNLSGHRLHSLFWLNLAPGKGKGPAAALSTQIKKDFGGLDAMQQQFAAAGAAIQGSGWAALSWEPMAQSLVIEQIHDHQDNRAFGATPLLVMDMWEHAFYLQYRNEKKRWIKAFWGLINWTSVAKGLDAAKGRTTKT
jgi:Fe-Mn family superoxide dismutase